MKEEKLKILQFIREFIVRVEKELDNFPKSYIEIKSRIRNNSYDLLEIVYEANCTTNIERKKELLEKAVAKIKVVDFLLNLSYEKELISSKKYVKLGQRMDDIIKYISGWLKKLNFEPGAQL